MLLRIVESGASKTWILITADGWRTPYKGDADKTKKLVKRYLPAGGRWSARLDKVYMGFSYDETFDFDYLKGVVALANKHLREDKGSSGETAAPARASDEIVTPVRSSTNRPVAPGAPSRHRRHATNADADYRTPGSRYIRPATRERDAISTRHYYRDPRTTVSRSSRQDHSGSSADEDERSSSSRRSHISNHFRN